MVAARCPVLGRSLKLDELEVHFHTPNQDGTSAGLGVVLVSQAPLSP